MLKPAEMTKVRVIILDKYLEDVIRRCGELGTLELTDLELGKESGQYVTPSPEFEELKQTSLLEKRIFNLLDILKVKETKDLFGAVTPPERMALKRESTEKQLKKVEDFLEKIEDSVIDTSKEIEKLGGEKSSLLDRKKILLQHKETLKILTELGGKPEWLGDSQFLYLTFGSIPKEKLETLIFIEEGLKKNFIFLEGKEREERVPILILARQEDKETLKKILEKLDWKVYDLPLLKAEKKLKEIQIRLEEIDREKGKLQKELEEIRKGYGEKLLAMREIVENEKKISELKSKSFKTGRMYLLEGWAPSKRVKNLEYCLEKCTKGHLFLKSYPRETEKAPTYLENPSFLKPFESLTSAFGLPNYREIDPTIFLTFTFPLFYGIMFGDIGHGALLALLGGTLSRLAKRSEGVKSLGMIILISGIFSMFFGFLYGDIFGLGPVEQEELFGFTLVHTFWMSPLEKPLTFLTLVFIMGAIQIGLGLVIGFINDVWDKNIREAFLGPFLKLWFYYSSLCLLIFLIISYGMDVGKWAQNLTLIMAVIAIPLFLLLISGIIKDFPKIKLKEIPALLGDGAFEIFDVPLTFLANTISYSRLFALALIHIGLFMALFEIVNFFIPPSGLLWIPWILVFGIGTIVIIALEAIIVFLHSLRLHYYEWFSKFFKADGIPFKPFKIKRVYTYIKRKGG